MGRGEIKRAGISPFFFSLSFPCLLAVSPLSRRVLVLRPRWLRVQGGSGDKNAIKFETFTERIRGNQGNSGAFGAHYLKSRLALVLHVF